MEPKFFFFDLGNVVLNFSHAKMCQQMGALLGASETAVRDFLFTGTDPEHQFESGQLTGPQFYELLCNHFDRRPPLAELAEASSAIFELNATIVPVLTQLAASGHKLGLLSNTHPWHWDWILRRGYGVLPNIFEVRALSYELKALKPHADIYVKAAQLSGFKPEEIFFTDDLPQHVAGAKAAGFDAVQYTTTRELVIELRRRGVEFNY